jgi:peptidoglycan/LPS O-acetylase OafA/YrhL
MSLQHLLSVPTAGSRIAAMEGLRGYAALLIYILHLTGQFLNLRFEINLDELKPHDYELDKPWLILADWLHSSHYGVDIFFALSGYLIAGIVSRDGFKYAPYIFNRFLRVYPVLITSTFIYVAYQILLHDSNIWWGGIVGNLLLLNGISNLNFPAINIVTWSLFFEISFYVTFPLVWFACKRQLNLFLCLSIFIVVLLSFVNDNYSRYIMFAVGVALRLCSQQTSRLFNSRFSDGQVALLYVAATISFMFVDSFRYFLPIFIFPAFLFIHHSIHLSGWLNRLFSNPILRYLGNISFSFYIYHPLALRLTHSILDKLGNWSNDIYLIGLTIISLTLSLVFAALSYVLIERLYFTARHERIPSQPRQA